MPLTQTQIQAAQNWQHAAAHDPARQVHLVAGPGTGKSSAIEERVCWLVGQGVQPVAIYAVSFTRASALDLRQRIHAHCSRNGYPTASQVRVTTLHSLALRTLRVAGLLKAYPTEPLVLDTWELEDIFDAEFGHTSKIGKVRSEKIRLDHEAFWSTGLWSPPNYIPPNPPISAAERSQFTAFHGPRTQSYSCVLPGEIVRECVTHMKTGTLNAVALLNLEHLVVDEFQDLNPMDLEFVDTMATQGAQLFVAGDDDQSIYSFRYASPVGIQNFITQYPLCTHHILNACFRCTPSILDTGEALIAANPPLNRIQKNNFSLYTGAVPPLNGIVHRWRFTSAVAEARVVAESCRNLISSGISARDILVLLSNQKVLLQPLATEFHNMEIDYEPPRTGGFLDSQTGRLVQAIVRVVCNTDDYVAHRVLLGLQPSVGIGTCNAITDAVIVNNLNYRSIFYQLLPSGVFSGRPLTALNKVRDICSTFQGWQATDTVVKRLNDIYMIVTGVLGLVGANDWKTYVSSLPMDMTLEELRDYLLADTDEQQATLLQAVMERLNLPIPTAGILPPRVRVMTMHGAKGLSGKIVFIPGLEEEILPGPWRQPYPGLVLEAARLLYVSITRARAACIISYGQNRVVHGKPVKHTPSRFTIHLGGPFLMRTGGLSSVEVQQIMNEVCDL